MPELPDLLAYRDALDVRVRGHRLRSVSVASPFLLRTVEPSLADAHGRTVVGVSLLGKRIVLELADEFFLAVHLMIAGRLHWRETGDRRSTKPKPLATFGFDPGSLILTEAGTTRRASLHVVHGATSLVHLDPGGIDVLAASERVFIETLRSENRTLKRALTDPHLVCGIGNAYSDEILHRAELSPVARTRALTDTQLSALFAATRATLQEWIARLGQDASSRWPDHVTAFRDGMAVHGRYGRPCPRCGAPIQRIRYASNESNYCPRCQTGGKILADRALSRLLHADWPRSLEELEEQQRQRRRPRDP